MAEVVQTHLIPSEENIDPDIFRHMNNLGCFRDKEKLIRDLLSTKHNTEKMVYFLLLDRKRRKPSYEDETEVILRNSTNAFDPPRKRVDTARYNRYCLGSLTDGSPINPRKTYGRVRHHSLGGSPSNSPRTSPLPVPRNYATQHSHGPLSGGGSNRVSAAHPHYYNAAGPTNSRGDLVSGAGGHHNHQQQPPYHQRGGSYKSPGNNNSSAPSPDHHQHHRTLTNDRPGGHGAVDPLHPHNLAPPPYSAAAGGCGMVGGPGGGSQTNPRPTPPPSPMVQQAWRSRLSNIKNSFLGSPRFHRRKMSGENDSDSEDSQMLDTSDLVKKSWFGSLTSSSSVDKEDTHCIMVQEKSLNTVKALLIRAFLTFHELNHSVVGQTSFRVEYKRSSGGAGGVFSRSVRMQVDIIASPHAALAGGELPTYVIQFTLIAGPVRRFRRLVDHLTSIILPQSARSNAIAAAAAAGGGDQHQKRGSGGQLLPSGADAQSGGVIQGGTGSGTMVRPRRLSDSSVSSVCSEAGGGSMMGGVGGGHSVITPGSSSSAHSAHSASAHSHSQTQIPHARSQGSEGTNPCNVSSKMGGIPGMGGGSAGPSPMMGNSMVAGGVDRGGSVFVVGGGGAKSRSNSSSSAHGVMLPLDHGRGNAGGVGGPVGPGGPPPSTGNTSRHNSLGFSFGIKSPLPVRRNTAGSGSTRVSPAGPLSQGSMIGANSGGRVDMGGCGAYGGGGNVMERSMVIGSSAGGGHMPGGAIIGAHGRSGSSQSMTAAIPVPSCTGGTHGVGGGQHGMGPPRYNISSQSMLNGNGERV